MGSVVPVWVPPLPLPASADPLLWSDDRVRDLERTLRWRTSRFEKRRRRAYEACLDLIRWRERDLGIVGPPVRVPPPKPTDARTPVSPRPPARRPPDNPCRACHDYVEVTTFGRAARDFLCVKCGHERTFETPRMGQVSA